MLELGNKKRLIASEECFTYANIVNFNSPHPRDIPGEVENSLNLIVSGRGKSLRDFRKSNKELSPNIQNVLKQIEKLVSQLD